MTAVCTHPKHDDFPQYGVGPHTCFYKLGKRIGESEPVPRAQWPANFIPDESTLEPTDACLGTWTCPGCHNLHERNPRVREVRMREETER